MCLRIKSSSIVNTEPTEENSIPRHCPSLIHLLYLYY